MSIEVWPDLVRDIVEFRTKFPWDGEVYRGKPRLLPEDQMKFWTNFILEEHAEMVGSHEHGCNLLGDENDEEITVALAEVLDAGVDLVYVTLGILQRSGLLPMFYEAWQRVHAANMAKECANGDASKSLRGNPWDVIKPPGWTPPDHTDLVADHAHREG